MERVAKRKQTPARTPEGRENQLIALAVNEAEKRLRNGTASSQIIAMLLKLATTKSQLEIEKIRSDISLQRAKEEDLMKRANSTDLYEQALAAFKSYKGVTDDYDDEEEYFDE